MDLNSLPMYKPYLKKVSRNFGRVGKRTPSKNMPFLCFSPMYKYKIQKKFQKIKWVLTLLAQTKNAHFFRGNKYLFGKK